MICDRIENLPHYRGLCRSLDAAIDFFGTHELAALPDGRTEIDGEWAFVNVMNTSLKPAAQLKWERHKLYADLQIGILGDERMAWAPTEQLGGWESFTEGRDIVQSDDPACGWEAPLSSGMFMLVFPWDAHKPGIGSGNGRKAVVKLKV